MMRHIRTVILLAGILMPLSLSASPSAVDPLAAVFPTGRVTVLARAALLFPADAEYRKIFGGQRPYFEFKIGADIIRNLYLWGGWGFFSGSGTIPIVDEQAETSQNILSLGAGYRLLVAPHFAVRAEAGISMISYKESGIGLEVSGSGIGIRAGVGGFYIISKTLFAEVGLDYASASSTTEDGLKLRLGGFTFGAGVGLRF